MSADKVSAMVVAVMKRANDLAPNSNFYIDGLDGVKYRNLAQAIIEALTVEAQAADVGEQTNSSKSSSSCATHTVVPAALTDEQRHDLFMQAFPMPEGLRASVYSDWQHDQLLRQDGWKAAWKAIEQHLRAAGQDGKDGERLEVPWVAEQVMKFCRAGEETPFGVETAYRCARVIVGKAMKAGAQGGGKHD